MIEGNIKKILITGSSGTIGTALCEHLIAKGYEVQGIDWKPNKWNAHVEEVTIQGDLRKKSTFKKLKTDYDLIIHFAANAKVYDSVKKPELAKDNFLTLFNVLEFARKNKIQRIMFSSSREVYGNTEKMSYDETDTHVEDSESPYAASKLGGETLVHSYQKCFGIKTVITRFSNVYGKYDESNRLVPLFIRLCKEGKPLTVFGKEKLLDFTYIDDTINGVTQIIENFDKVKNNTFNLAYGQGSSILNVAEMIQTGLNTKTPIRIKESRPGEVVRYIAKIDKAKAMLNYNPQIPIQEGIKRSLGWYNKNIYK